MNESAEIATPGAMESARLRRMREVFRILREEAEHAARSRPSAEPEMPPGSAAATPEAVKGWFGLVELLFTISLVLAILGAVYGNRQVLAERFPQLAPHLEQYAEFVTPLRNGILAALGRPVVR
ncbi:MAG: hypothetical protein OXF74_07635 [Rhodobacteraceae bacterium]|nr:hypothetical protein [Paracoccaceae bacterium]